MTFTIIARNPKTNAVGVCQGTGGLAVASRCPHVRAGVAAVSSQSHPDWRLGPRGLDLAEGGLEPAKIIEALRATDEHFEHRQFGIVTADGRAAVHTGSKCRDYASSASGDGVIVMGNGLVGPQVVRDIFASYQAGDHHGDSDIDFADRLLRAVEAGTAAGGEANGQVAATIIVAAPHTPRPLIDLRVEFVSPLPTDGGEAVTELRRVFNKYAPLAHYYAEYWPDHPKTTPEEWLQMGSPMHG